MKVTIRDVARQAGVSVATVSRVFNDSGPVRPDTRQRVRDIARSLRYTPNRAARSLTTSRTHTIGVLLPDLYGEFFSEVIRAIDQAAQGRGFHLLVSNSHNAFSGLEAALQAMRGRVDGLIVMAPDLDSDTVEATIPTGVRAILLNCRSGSGIFDAINIDNYGGAYAMTRHLLEHGYRRVALVQGSEGNHDAEERLRGYRDAMRECGGAWSEPLELPGNFTVSSGYEAARKALALDPRPEAIFSSNDAMAIGVIGALREAGVRVPAQMAVAGFDDIPISRYVSPPLSTVEVLINELGARACLTLLDGVDGDEAPPSATILPTRLSLRGSCGCPCPGDA